MVGVFSEMMMVEKMTGEAPEVRSDKENLVEPYLSINQDQSALISINQHQLASISTSISFNQS